MKRVKYLHISNTRNSHLVVCLIVLFWFRVTCAQDMPFRFPVSLRGKSSGGILTLMKAPGWNYPYVAVTNDPGETAASVIRKLNLELANCSACAEWYGRRRHGVVEIGENELVLVGPDPWIFGGTEAGFGIPAPPIAVSMSYDVATDRVIFQWANHKNGYDSVQIVYLGSALASLPGTTTRYEHKRGGFIDAGFSSAELTFFVLAQKSGTPSNGAGVRLRRHVQQESLMNVPFTQGVAPGFTRWTHNTAAEAMKFEQGNLPGMAPAADVQKFRGKGFYQVLKGQGTFVGGVARRFLGLNAGHAYRMGARLSMLESKKGNWAFTFHAAYNPASGEDLTPGQMAGEVALANGAKGKTAGQIARYDSTTTTDGKWVERSSEKKTADNPTGDITLPAKGSDSITIWFRLEGKDAHDVAVGLDSVTLEDLGEKK